MWGWESRSKGAPEPPWLMLDLNDPGGGVRFMAPMAW